MSGSALQQTRRSPRTLRDLLNESNSIPSPSPSNGFKRIPRNPIPSTTMRSLIEMDINTSSRNSNRRILNSLLNAFVKRFYSFAVKYPTILPRSISRRLSRKSNSRNCRELAETKVPLRIKDIVRWKSFSDLDKEQSQPLDFSSASSSCSSSKGSSWSDSDFSSCDGNLVECSRNDVIAEKRFSPLVGVDSVYATTGNPAGPKGDLSLRRQEEEQRSPVSVLEIEEYYEENNEIDDEQEGDMNEKMAWKLLQYVKSNASVQRSNEAYLLEKLLLDFFKDEMKKRRVDEDDSEFVSEILRRTQDWMNGSFGDDFENSDKNACVRDMDERERWSKFEDEKQELACEIETGILENLIVEVFNCSFSC